MATFLVRYARLLLAASVFVGIALPPVAALLRPVLTHSVAALLFLAMLRVQWRHLLDYVRQPRWMALGVVWLLAGSPLLMWAALNVIPLPEGIAAALVLMAAAPPIMSAPALAALLGLETALTLILVCLATLLSPLTVPPAAAWLVGAALHVDLATFALRMAALVFGSLGVAVLVRSLAGEERVARSAPLVDAGSVVVLILFAVAIMDGVGVLLMERPAFVVAMIAGSYAANLALQLVSVALFGWWRWREALTVGFVAGNRNMAILMAALPPSADSDTFLWFALAQFPIYTLPALLTRPYTWLLRHKPAAAVRSPR